MSNEQNTQARIFIHVRAYALTVSVGAALGARATLSAVGITAFCSTATNRCRMGAATRERVRIHRVQLGQQVLNLCEFGVYVRAAKMLRHSACTTLDKPQCTCRVTKVLRLWCDIKNMDSRACE